jgi:hypothetical protein
MVEVLASFIIILVTEAWLGGGNFGLGRQFHCQILAALLDQVIHGEKSPTLTNGVILKVLSY